MYHVFRLKTFSTAVVNTRSLIRSNKRLFVLLNACNVDTHKNNGMVSINWNRTLTTDHEQTVPSDGLNGKDTNSKQVTFEELFKSSRFVDMLDPVGKLVDGKIIAVDGPNLYIDFGGKFHGVAIRPHKHGNRYVKGAQVKVLIKDLEVGMHFLGSNTDTSLLEASVEIVGLYKIIPYIDNC